MKFKYSIFTKDDDGIIYHISTKYVERKVVTDELEDYKKAGYKSNCVYNADGSIDILFDRKKRGVTEKGHIIFGKAEVLTWGLGIDSFNFSGNKEMTVITGRPNPNKSTFGNIGFFMPKSAMTFHSVPAEMDENAILELGQWPVADYPSLLTAEPRSDSNAARQIVDGFLKQIRKQGMWVSLEAADAATKEAVESLGMSDELLEELVKTDNLAGIYVGKSRGRSRTIMLSDIKHYLSNKKSAK